MPIAETPYSAAAFHSDFDGGRKTGTLYVGSSAIRFEGEGSSVSVPIRDLQLRAGGAGERLIFFTHPRHPEWSLYTSDRSVLDHPSLMADSGTAAAVARIRSQKRKGFAIAAAMFAAIFGVLALLVFLKDPIVRMVVRRIPPSIEQKLGDVAVRQVLLMQNTVTDRRVVAPLESLLARLVRAAGTRQTFRLYVVRDSNVNAFALPGGHVLINTGLLEKAGSGEEVAGVVAHEIAHVTERHSLQQLVSTIGVFTLVQLLLGDVSGIIAVAADGGAQLLTMSFSRDAEREADRRGVDFLQNAKIDPRGMLAFFAKLQEEEKVLAGGKAGEALELLSTHPTTGDRIAALQRDIERRGNPADYQKLDLDLAAIKAALSNAGKEGS